MSLLMSLIAPRQYITCLFLYTTDRKENKLLQLPSLPPISRHSVTHKLLTVLFYAREVIFTNCYFIVLFAMELCYFVSFYTIISLSDKCFCTAYIIFLVSFCVLLYTWHLRFIKKTLVKLFRRQLKNCPPVDGSLLVLELDVFKRYFFRS